MNIFKTNQKFLLILLTIALALVSCQKEENPSIDSEKAIEAFDNWMKADLSQIFSGTELNYTVDNQKFLELSSLDNASEIRFIPGVINNKLTIRIAAVDPASQKIIADLWVTDSKETKLLDQLKNRKPYAESVTDKEILSHQLSFEKLTTYLSNWNQKSKTDINEMATFNGERLRFTAYPAKVIQHIAKQNTKETIITWGINDENKMTTVFLIFKNSKSIEGFDDGSPCPPACP